MATVSDKFRSLVDRLYDRTISGNLSWEIDDSDRSVFCQTGEFKIKLLFTRNAEGEPFEKIEITNDFGVIIDSFTDAVVNEKHPSEAAFATYYSKMLELRNHAKRQAVGADAALDSIIKHLGN